MSGSMKRWSLSVVLTNFFGRHFQARQNQCSFEQCLLAIPKQLYFCVCVCVCYLAGVASRFCPVDGFGIPTPWGREAPANLESSHPNMIIMREDVFESVCRTVYATALTPGPVKLRPWQLGYRADFGFASMAEPEDMETLIRLIGSEGFAAHRVFLLTGGL